MDALGLFKRDDVDGTVSETGGDSRDTAEAGAAGSPRAPASHLYKRNLCPICPSGASVSSPYLLLRTFGDWLGMQFCCPSRSIVTITSTRTATKTSTVIAKAIHAGRAFDDNNKDGRYTAGIDDPIAGKWVVIRHGSKILGRAKTDARGRYTLVTKAYPKARLSISLLRLPRTLVKMVITNRSGGSQALIPVAPPVIKLSAFYDLDLDGLKAANEKLAAGTVLLIKFTNGTLWKRISLDAGVLAFRYRHRMPNMPLIVQTRDGKVTMRIRLDARGHVLVMLPIPGVSAAANATFPRQ